MSSFRIGFGVLFVAGCAATYPAKDLPPPPDFSVEDMGVPGAGGNGGPDLGAGGPPPAADLAASTGVPDLAAAADLAPACVVGGGLVDADGGVAPSLWLAAPTAGGLFSARRLAGSWTTLAAVGGAVDDVSLATVNGRPLVAARLHDSTLTTASYDDCRAGFAPLAAPAPAASTAVRPSLVGGGAAELVFRGSVNGDQRYYWAHFDGAAWAAIATESNFLSPLPPSAVRAAGAVHVIFAGSDTNLWDGVVQTTGGGTATQLSGNTSSKQPAAAVAPDGTVHVVYTGTNGHVYWTTTTHPSTVHDLCDGQPTGCYIVTDAAPSLAFASDGSAVALFHGTDGRLYASRLVGTQWGAATAVSAGETTSLAPAIVGGVDGDLVDVVYVRASDGAARQVALTAAGWQAPATVAGAALTGAPALAVTQ